MKDEENKSLSPPSVEEEEKGNGVAGHRTAEKRMLNFKRDKREGLLLPMSSDPLRCLCPPPSPVAVLIATTCAAISFLCCFFAFPVLVTPLPKSVIKSLESGPHVKFL